MDKDAGNQSWSTGDDGELPRPQGNQHLAQLDGEVACILGCYPPLLPSATGNLAISYHQLTICPLLLLECLGPHKQI